MCHVLSKPFDVPAMLALIARLCHGQAITTGQAPPQNDAEALDVAAGLALWLDGAAYRQYLAQFLDLHGDSVRSSAPAWLPAGPPKRRRWPINWLAWPPAWPCPPRTLQPIRPKACCTPRCAIRALTPPQSTWRH